MTTPREPHWSDDADFRAVHRRAWRDAMHARECDYEEAVRYVEAALRDSTAVAVAAYRRQLRTQVEALRAEIETSIYATIQGANYEADERPECSAMASRDANGLAGEMFDAVLGLLGGDE